MYIINETIKCQEMSIINKSEREHCTNLFKVPVYSTDCPSDLKLQEQVTEK
jgi:hypothetical protein